MTEAQLEDIVATDLATNRDDVEDAQLTWEEYAQDMWTDRGQMFEGFPRHLSFVAWRALVRRAAGSLGLLP